MKAKDALAKIQEVKTFLKAEELHEAFENEHNWKNTNTLAQGLGLELIREHNNIYITCKIDDNNKAIFNSHDVTKIQGFLLGMSFMAENHPIHPNSLIDKLIVEKVTKLVQVGEHI